MRPTVLVTGTPSAFVRDRLAASFDVVVPAAGADPVAALADIGPRVRAVASAGHHGVTAAMMDALPGLEIVAHFGVGYDAVDVAAAAARGVVVTNTPDVLTDEVADTAIGLLLMTVRELSAAERWLREGRWVREGAYPLTRGTLVGRTVGLLGLGRIGRAIARRLEGFGLAVHYHSRNKVADAPYPWHPSAETLAAAVDTLVVTLPGGAATERVVGARVLEALGPEGILINVGRGSVVDEPALVAALGEGRILGAGLDVFADEPHVPAALLDLPRVVVLPHVGSASTATRDRMGALQVDNLLAWFDGRPLPSPVPETPIPSRRGEP